MKLIKGTAFVSCCLALSLYSTVVAAQLTSQGMLDQVVTEFATRAVGWQSVVMRAAMWLFWTLGTISLVWTGGMMALRKADLGEFFAEFTRFILFFGFFLWLLRNGPAFASSIIQSLQRIGEQASGVSSITPSGIVDVGFMIWKQAITNLSVWQPIDSFVGVVLSGGILVLLALIAVNMLLVLVSAWILMYAGIFFLGFGGSRWTSDIAINYYKTVLGIAVQLMAMVLLVGIGSDLLSSFYAKMNKGALNFHELGVMLVFCLALLALVNRIPALLFGVLTGSSVGAGGIGNFGAGMALGAAGVAVSAGGMATSAAIASAANIAGGASALMAAVSKGRENVSAGTDVLAGFGGGSAGASARETVTTGSSPYAEAAGFAPGLSGSGMSGVGGASGQRGGARTDAKSKANGAKGAGGDGKAQGASGGGGKGGVAGGQRAGPEGGPGVLASAANAAGTVGRIAADAGANLAKGTAEVVRAKGASVKEAFRERVGETTGGKIAAAIRWDEAPLRELEEARRRRTAPTFGENSLAAADSEPLDREAEIAAFVNRDRDNKTP